MLHRAYSSLRLVRPSLWELANKTRDKGRMRVRMRFAGFFFLFISLAVTGGSAWASTDACPGNLREGGSGLTASGPITPRPGNSLGCRPIVVAAGKWFLQRLDGEKPDVFCHATQLMHGAEAARLTPLNAVDRMYVAARGFQPRGKPNHQQRYCVEHIARGTPQLSPSRRMARRAEPWCVSDT